MEKLTKARIIAGIAKIVLTLVALVALVLFLIWGIPKSTQAFADGFSAGWQNLPSWAPKIT